MNKIKIKKKKKLTPKSDFSIAEYMAGLHKSDNKLGRQKAA